MQSATRPALAPHHGNSLSELTGADTLFDALVEAMVPQLRPALPQLSAQGMRERLSAFRPQFEAMYRRVLEQHLGAQVPALFEELSHADARAYFGARRSMAPELGQMLQQLSFEMGKTSV